MEIDENAYWTFISSENEDQHDEIYKEPQTSTCGKKRSPHHDDEDDIRLCKYTKDTISEPDNDIELDGFDKLIIRVELEKDCSENKKAEPIITGDVDIKEANELMVEMI